MKEAVIVRNWGHCDPVAIEALGFERPNPKGNPTDHGAYFVTAEEKWAILKRLYDGGFNVMAIHTRFKQIQK